MALPNIYQSYYPSTRGPAGPSQAVRDAQVAAVIAPYIYARFASPLTRGRVYTPLQVAQNPLADRMTYADIRPLLPPVVTIGGAGRVPTAVVPDPFPNLPIDLLRLQYQKPKKYAEELAKGKIIPPTAQGFFGLQKRFVPGSRDDPAGVIDPRPRLRAMGLWRF